MDDNDKGSQGRAVCRLSTGFSVSCALVLGVLLSWKGVYANAEQSATVHIGEFANVTIDVDSQSLGVGNPDTSAIVESTGTESKSAVHLDTGKGEQYSQLDLAGSQDMRSLDVVDTGSSVEFPTAVGELGGGIDDQKKANVDPGNQPVTVSNDMIDQGVQPGTEKPIHTDSELSDAVHLDTGKGEQYSQLELAGSQDMRSLDVVDTGSSVEFPTAVGELGGGIDDQKKANVDPGNQPVTVSNDMIDQGDQPLVTGTSVKLPVTNAADAHSQVGDAGGRQLENVSNDAVSEESAGLPYAVVLALLALIGLVPVARRDDRHQV